MKKITKSLVYEVKLVFNVEASCSTEAMDKVLSCNPIKPTAFKCVPLNLEDDEY